MILIINWETFDNIYQKNIEQTVHDATIYINNYDDKFKIKGLKLDNFFGSNGFNVYKSTNEQCCLDTDKSSIEKSFLMLLNFKNKKFVLANVCWDLGYAHEIEDIIIFAIGDSDRFSDKITKNTYMITDKEKFIGFCEKFLLKSIKDLNNLRTNYQPDITWSEFKKLANRVFWMSYQDFKKTKYTRSKKKGKNKSLKKLKKSALNEKNFFKEKEEIVHAR